MREFATTENRLTASARSNLGNAVKRIEALKRERRTATFSRINVIDAELRRLNQHCEAIISRG